MMMLCLSEWLHSGPSLWYVGTRATDALSLSSLTISLPYGTFFEETEISSVEIVFYLNRRNLDLFNFLPTATDDLSPSVIFFDDKDGEKRSNDDR